MLRYAARLFTLLLSCACITLVHAGYFPTPLSMPDASKNFIKTNHDDFFAGSVFYEEGSGGGGFNASDQKTTLGSMYSSSESLLTMMRNPQGDIRTKINAIDPRLLTAPDFGGRRGAVDIGGHVFHRQITLGGDVQLRFITMIPGYADLALYLPFVNKRFDAISVKQRAFDPVDIIDLRLEQISRDVNGLLQQLGNLSAEAWQGSGVGDPTLIMRWNWQHLFNNTDLQTIATQLYFGFSVPISNKKDEDKIFSLPMGNDGHWGIPFGANAELTFSLPIKLGVHLDLLWLVAESRERRIKTDLSQTSLLLLHKAMTQRKPGLVWRLNWFAEGFNVWRGLSCRGGYEFMMHHNDELKTEAAGFRSEIINTAETNQHWYVHSLTTAARYNLSHEFKGAPVTPVIEAFLKFPVSGHRIVNASTAGMQIILNF